VRVFSIGRAKSIEIMLKSAGFPARQIHFEDV
jgi:hypothetical protein